MLSLPCDSSRSLLGIIVVSLLRIEIKFQSSSPTIDSCTEQGRCGRVLWEHRFKRSLNLCDCLRLLPKFWNTDMWQARTDRGKAPKRIVHEHHYCLMVYCHRKTAYQPWSSNSTSRSNDMFTSQLVGKERSVLPPSSENNRYSNQLVFEELLYVSSSPVIDFQTKEIEKSFFSAFLSVCMLPHEFDVVEIF